MTAVPRGPQVNGFVNRCSIFKAADRQLCGFKLVPKRSRHKYSISADTLFKARVEFDMDGDDGVMSDDPLSSQADENNPSNELSSGRLSLPED